MYTRYVSRWGGRIAYYFSTQGCMRAPWPFSSLWSVEPLVAAAAFLALRSKKFDMMTARYGVCLKKLIDDINNGCLKLSRWSYLPAQVTLRVSDPLGDAPCALEVGTAVLWCRTPQQCSALAACCAACWEKHGCRKCAALGRMVLHWAVNWPVKNMERRNSSLSSWLLFLDFFQHRFLGS